ncbi:MAG: alpha/beta fold hydrolase [Candidatus Heimdallarchaeota archaeon]|nr:alpha/beta fold hydrolase [Candidatus Heimdallarchaeota archaeon]
MYHEVLNPEGSSPPMYLLHTIPFDHNYLKESLLGIKIPNRIILIDLPSHGKSENVDREHMNFKQFAKDIEQLREELGDEMIILYGHGFGGFIAFTYGYMYYRRLHALIVSNSAVSATYRTQMAWNIRSQFDNEIKDIFHRLTGNLGPDSVIERFELSLFTYFHPASKQKAQEIFDSAERIATEAYVILSHFDVASYNVRDKVRIIKAPTLILGGAYDVMPHEEVKKINKDIHHGKLHFFPSGHFPMKDMPEKYWNTIFEWIGQLN